MNGSLECLNSIASLAAGREEKKLCRSEAPYIGPLQPSYTPLDEKINDRAATGHGMVQRGRQGSRQKARPTLCRVVPVQTG